MIIVVTGPTGVGKTKISIEIAKRAENKNIVTIFPDTGMRYLSEDIW